jgi:hypothetical protein
VVSQPIAAPMPEVMAMVKEGQDDGLLLLDGATGATVATLASGPCACPCWSPDGRRLVFWRDGDLMLATAGQSDTEVLTGGVSAQARRPFAFRQAGDWLAAAVHGGVVLIPLDDPTAQGARLTLAADMEADVLLWTGAGDVLAILCHARVDHRAPSAGRSAGQAIAQSQLVRWRPGTGEADAIPATFDLIGSRGAGDLVVTQVAEEWPDRRAALLTSTGELVPLLDAAEGQSVYAYLRQSDTIVLCEEGDFALVPAVGGTPHPCLQGLSGLLEVAFSESGDWAALVLDPPDLAEDFNGIGLVHLASGTQSWGASAALRGLEFSILRDVALAPTLARWKP